MIAICKMQILLFLMIFCSGGYST